MDDRRFDALVRGLAGASNRRQVLRGLFGLGGGVAATSLDRAEAARRPAPTPKPVSCPGEQTWNGSQCVCPTGKDKCGPDCCVPGISECCGNACCFGDCYGEELCCPTGSIFCDGACRDWGCCSDSDCSGNATCNPTTHTCQCIPNCDGRTCGDDGCGGQCGTCPDGQICSDGSCECASGHLCSNDVCQQCCDASDCVADLGGDAECWSCSSGQCGYYSGFCSGGVCGTSSHDVVGHCIACGQTGNLSPDGCSAAVPCCTGYACDFMYGDVGFCRVAP